MSPCLLRWRDTVDGLTKPYAADLSTVETDTVGASAVTDMIWEVEQMHMAIALIATLMSVADKVDHEGGRAELSMTIGRKE